MYNNSATSTISGIFWAIASASPKSFTTGNKNGTSPTTDS